MHSLVDIIAGLALGLAVLAFWLTVHEYVDNFIISGQNVLSFWSALSFLLLFAYPTPELPTPSFEFHTAFNGVALGIVAGVHLTYYQFHHEAAPLIFSPQLSIPAFVGRILVGMPTILLVKFCSKALAKWIVPVISNISNNPITHISSNMFKMFLLIVLAIVTLILIIRFLSKTSFLHILLNKYRSFEDWFHVYQSYKIPQYNENNNLQENLLYGKVSTYLNSLASLEDSQFTNLFTGSKCNDIILNLDANQTVVDTFLGARVYWTNGVKELTMRFRKKDKRRILRPYLQHVLSVAEENESKQREIRLHFNLYDNGRCCWRSIPFTHPATMDSVVLDGDVKNRVKSDLELFLKSKQYYNKLGRVWKRSYLLYGPSGTGKSSFVAAMARFLCYDVYDIDLSTVSDVSDLKLLLLQTKSKSLILVEGIDKFLLSSEKSTAAGMLNFMDGVTSCCGEERVLVFTMNGKDRIGDGDGDDQTAMMRPGRIDVKVEFPLCDFSTFKNLAGNYLGVKDHKLFGQVEEGFQNGSSLSPAQIGELLISNRTSPTRAFKSVITALQQHQPNKQVEKVGAKSSDHGSGQPMDDGLLCRESVHTVREFRKLYGLLKGSRRKEEPPLDLSSIEKSGSRHDQT